MSGTPDKGAISTSLVERTSLSLRMGMHGFARPTNSFSKKLENHIHAVSFYFMVYQFREDPRRHQDNARDGGGRDGPSLEHGRHRVDVRDECLDAARWAPAPLTVLTRGFGLPKRRSRTPCAAQMRGSPFR